MVERCRFKVPPSVFCTVVIKNSPRRESKWKIYLKEMLVIGNTANWDNSRVMKSAALAVKSLL